MDQKEKRLQSVSSFDGLFHEKNDRSRNSPSTSSETSVSSLTGRTSMNILVVLVAIFFVISSLAFTFSIMLYLKYEDLEFRLRQHMSTPHIETNELCVPCQDLVRGPFEEDTPELKHLTQTSQNGTMVCCARSSKQSSVLLELLLQRKIKERCAQAEPNKTCNVNGTGTGHPPHHSGTIAAHLLVGLQRTPEGKRLQPVRNWSFEDSIAHLTNPGLELKNDRVVVMEGGLYFVYSQIYFEIYFDTAQATTAQAHALYHYIYRYNIRIPNGGTEQLMKSARTQCWDQKKEYVDYTSYVGATVFLSKDDELYVTVSNTSLVSREPKASFFGLYRIS